MVYVYVHIVHSCYVVAMPIVCLLALIASVMTLVIFARHMKMQTNVHSSHSLYVLIVGESVLHIGYGPRSSDRV